DLLEDHLLRRLRVNATQVYRGQRVDDEVADLGVLLQLLPRSEVDLLEIILDRLDDLDDAPQTKVAGLRIELRADVVLGAVARARGALDRFLDRLDDDALVDHLLAGDRIGNREQLGLVGGNGSGHQSCPSSSISSAPSIESGTVAAINLSVRTSFAVSIASNGSLCSTPSLSKIVTVSPSIPASSPLKRWRPSRFSVSAIFASCPAQSAKSARRVSGRSMPGDETSSR